MATLNELAQQIDAIRAEEQAAIDVAHEQHHGRIEEARQRFAKKGLAGEELESAVKGFSLKSSATFIADKKRIRAEFAPRIDPIVRARTTQWEIERGGAQ